ncbi:MAG TPA: PEP-CTERM sorting domain-containing protein [Erythrobacter sp.]|jgi:hypothetical protein|nr:PEP-CTERM sorting domain-containing protein [Sphingomonadaceae bacterium]RZP19543.1 MAG: PEP-CTERM sorting domain-containing protein [Erythrobacter sp.]HAL91101.1 PEP-CTERM sorting domain-containing protein [Erythrobacter sp.]HAV80310.1 PEP-CTERM sorting domain-containing protein [Erythrobacter sp.]HCC27416.1 PEP-CTERM sorting domain-containing protein [Erythrobacter sp.]|tara:strand:- start:71 stop:334 length:264 start_codon:yes stop_codon:yes gene_type:complete
MFHYRRIRIIRGSFMRLLQTALLTASLLVTATSAAAMTRPPSDSGGGNGSGGTAVPEPGALAMMGTGIAGYGAAVALYRRKKRKRGG